MEKIKLVAENLQEWEKLSDLDRIDEGWVKDMWQKAAQVVGEKVGSPKASLKAFVKNPEETDFLTAAFAQHVHSSVGKRLRLKDQLLGLGSENQVKIAKQALKVMEDDPKKGIPKLIVKDKKIVGAGAIGKEERKGVMGTLGGS